METGILIGFSLLGSLIALECCKIHWKRRRLRMIEEPMLPKHSKVRNIIPLSNEERGSQPHSISQGTHDKSNNQPSLRSNLLRVSGGRRVVPTLPSIPEV